jgi:copper(I)-binding protein
MMTRRTWTALVLAAVISGPGAAVAAVAQDKPIVASDGTVLLPAVGATGAIAVATIDNTGMYAFYVVSGSSDVAAKVEFRDASKGNAILQQITCEQGGATYLDPKGVHIYLSGLKRELKEGETITIDLKTELGLPVTLEAKVKKE